MVTEAGAGGAGADGQDPLASAGAADPATGQRANADGVMDLLGLLAYASLVAFFQLSADAALATSLDDKAALAGIARAQFGHLPLVRDQIERAHAVPAEAMRPF